MVEREGVPPGPNRELRLSAWFPERFDANACAQRYVEYIQRLSPMNFPRTRSVASSEPFRNGFATADDGVICAEAFRDPPRRPDAVVLYPRNRPIRVRNAAVLPSTLELRRLESMRVERLQVYSNMEIVRTSLALPEFSVRGDDVQQADVVWMYEHIADFASLAPHQARSRHVSNYSGHGS
jgi:hypothetical protein